MAIARLVLEDRFFANNQRIQRLMEFSSHGTDSWKSAEAANDNVHADLYRAVIVFLHAMFEDMLRTAVSLSLGAKHVKKLQSRGVGAHRGRQLVKKSVEHDLRRMSFSSCADVKKVVRQMGFDTALFEPLFPDLEGMMKRRHQIVHEADLPTRWAKAPRQWTVDDNYLLLFSVLAVQAFYWALIASDDPAREPARWLFAKFTEAIKRAKQMYNTTANAELLASSQKASGSLIEALGISSWVEEARAILDNWEQRETPN